MHQPAPVFEEIYADYLAQVAAVDMAARAGRLGIHVAGDTARIGFLDASYSVSPRGIADAAGKKPPHAVCVVLCKYILLCPDAPDGREDLVTYKDFRDAGPYVGGFRNTAERPIARYFSGRMADLEKRALDLGGRPFPSGVGCDLSFSFNALPRVPVHLLFTDADDEFPASCTLLFHRNAASYLDMECIAMVGMSVADRLKKGI